MVSVRSLGQNKTIEGKHMIVKPNADSYSKIWEYNTASTNVDGGCSQCVCANCICSKIDGEPLTAKQLFADVISQEN